MKRIALFLPLFAFSLLFTQCKKDDSTPATYTCDGITPTYTGQVKALMDQHCATGGCHNASTRADGIDLSTYALTRSEAEVERFMASMEHRSGFRAMPEGASKLSDSDLQILGCWIQNGMPE